MKDPEPEEEEKPAEKEKRFDSEGNEIEEEEEEAAPAEIEEEENEEEKNKKLKKEPPVAPILKERPEPSERDTMIELQTKALLQTSSTMLAVSCFKSCQVLICNVDIKTRSRTIRSKITNKQSPTFLYQIDDDHLLVGTMGGKFEIWNIDPNQEQPTIK